MATSQVMEIKAKNVECLKTLISVAQTDGNYLGEAWYDVSIKKIKLKKIIDMKLF
jgi:brefeldin A-inhibited guanine nucleotide-exchange protein